MSDDKKANRRRKGVTRRTALTGAAAMGALPFVMAVPTLASRRPKLTRAMLEKEALEAEYVRAVEERLAQTTIPGIGVPPRSNPSLPPPTECWKRYYGADTHDGFRSKRTYDPDQYTERLVKDD
ncbi:MAG: hypothetical protein KDJ16_09740 [Hyphomicrobiales bacterium]|nr:hypothetical protein [Hyphomicrobiales bacterium]